MAERINNAVEIICRKIMAVSESIAQMEQDIIHLQAMGEDEHAMTFVQMQVNELDQLQQLTVVLTNTLTTNDEEDSEKDQEERGDGKA